MFEVLTEWVGYGSAYKVSVMYVDEEVDVATFRTAWIAFLNNRKGHINGGYTARVLNTGRTIDPLTGALTGQWVSGTTTDIKGTSTTTPVPDASQAMIKWRTGIVRNGRFLQGRTYIPGFATNLLQDGNVSSAAKIEWDSALNTFLTATPGLVIWSRPGDTSGAAFPVTSAELWSELAVLRRRRG